MKVAENMWLSEKKSESDRWKRIGPLLKGKVQLIFDICLSPIKIKKMWENMDQNEVYNIITELVMDYNFIRQKVVNFYVFGFNVH